MKRVAVLVLCSIMAGCSVYEDAQKGLARATSPHYRAFEAQQRQEHEQHQQQIEKKKLCEKAAC